MKVGYAVLYEDGTLTISKEHTILPKPILKDYDKFEDGLRPWLLSSEKIKTVRILNQVKPFTVYGWFYHCKNLTTLIDFQNLDVSDCEDFSYVFHGCELLTDISSLKNWNVSNGKNFSWMFYSCESLETLKGLDDWNVSNSETFEDMFYGCKSLIDITPLKYWNVSNGINFSGMFEHCKSLQNINELQNWDVSNCEDFSYMFGYIKNLQEIFLPNTLKQIKWKIFWNCNKNLKIHWKNKIYTYEDLLEYQEF